MRLKSYILYLSGSSGSYSFRGVPTKSRILSAEMFGGQLKIIAYEDESSPASDMTVFALKNELEYYFPQLLNHRRIYVGKVQDYEVFVDFPTSPGISQPVLNGITDKIGSEAPIVQTKNVVDLD